MIYQYQCDHCNKISEFDQSIKDKPRRKCPSCGKLKLKRRITGGTGFILKGQGWYKDGYK